MMKRFVCPVPIVSKRQLRADCRLVETNSMTGRQLSRPIGTSGKTPFDVIGQQLKLRKDGVRLLEERLDAASEWSTQKIALVNQITDRACSAINKMQTAPIEHPWHGTELDIQNAFDTDRLTELLAKCLEELDGLSSQLNNVFLSITGKGEPSLDDAKGIVRALRHLAAAPEASRIALNRPVWITDLPRIEAAIAHGRKFSELSKEITSQFHDDAWTFDPGPLLLTLRGDGPSFFRRLTGRYRQGQANLRSLCRSKSPRSLNDRIAFVEKLRDAQVARMVFSENVELLSSALQSIWNGLATSWDEASRLAAWARVALTLLGKNRIFELAACSRDLSVFGEFANRLEDQLQRAEIVVSSMADHVKPSRDAPFGATRGTIPISRLRKISDTWLSTIDKANDWVSVRNALASLKTEGCHQSLANSNVEL